MTPISGPAPNSSSSKADIHITLEAFSTAGNNKVISVSISGDTSPTSTVVSDMHMVRIESLIRPAIALALAEITRSRVSR
jgi:hypothetical protein